MGNFGEFLKSAGNATADGYFFTKNHEKIKPIEQYG
nr:MAG TPA: hypothetical protein [Bacteriophage sp.]